MDRGIEELARLLVGTAERHGHALAVDTPGARHGRGGGFRVSLGRGATGRAAMLRLPAACEGGRTAMAAPPIGEDGVPEETRAWIEEWALMELGGIRAHEAALVAEGASPDALHAPLARASAIALRLLRAVDADLPSLLAGAAWTRDQHGWRTVISDPSIAGDNDGDVVVHRIRGDLMFPGLRVRAGRAFHLEDHADGRWTALRVDARGVPETAIAAVEGRRHDEIVEMPGDHLGLPMPVIASASIGEEFPDELSLVIARDAGPIVAAGSRR